MEDIELITKEEKEFISFYLNRMKSIQNITADGNIAYTRIPMTYAILNKLFSVNLVFHPKSLSLCKEPCEVTLVTIKQALKEIIEYELYTDDNVLSRYELNLIIEHFKHL